MYCHVLQVLTRSNAAKQLLEERARCGLCGLWVVQHVQRGLPLVALSPSLSVSSPYSLPPPSCCRALLPSGRLPSSSLLSSPPPLCRVAALQSEVEALQLQVQEAAAAREEAKV